MRPAVYAGALAALPRPSQYSNIRVLG